MSGTYDECGGTLEVDWTFTDKCDRTITAKKVITVLPAPEAAFEPVEDMTITCEEANVFEPSSLSYTNNGTGPCLIAGEVPGELSGSYDECGGTLEVDWTYTDDCGRTITAKKTITVEPAPMAAFEPVQDMTVSCEEAALVGTTFVSGFQGDFAAGNWSQDLGGSNGSITITDTEMTIVGGNDGSNSVTIAEATCPTGGQYSFSWNFASNDGSAFWDPAFYVNGVPVIQLTEDGGGVIQSGTVSVNCAAGDVIGFGVESLDGLGGAATLTISDFIVGEATMLSYTNNGTGACEISGSVPAELSGSYDECGGTLYLDWSFTDNCGRTITAQKVVTVEPAPQAEFAPIDDASIACEDLATYEPEFLSYTNGGTGACEISGEVQGEAEPFDGSCGTFDVDFTFTDDCGRTITAKQTITVIDETPPVMVGEVPGGESFVNACFDNRPEGPSIETIAAAFEDNCGNVNVTKNETVVESSDCQWAVFYVYTISDDCGNFANNVKISYFGSDQNAPQLTGNLPVGTEGLQCLAENPGVPEDVVAQITAAYTEDCGEVIVTPLDPIFSGDDCDWTVTYEYTVQDSCGNYADNVVIINKGSDTTAPVYNGELDDTFTNTTLCFDSELGEPSADEMAEFFSDNCDQDLTITKTVQAFGNDCQWLKVFIYTAEDDCGNVSEPVKINYEGLDEEAPQPTGQCDNEVMTFGTEIGVDCPQDASISLEVGNEISAYDNSWTVAGLTVAELGGTLVPCFTDNCAELEELTYRVIAKDEDKSDCSTTLSVTFEVEDLCNNISEPFVCTFIIVDDTPPVVTCPEGTDFGIVDEAPTAFADKAPYSDNCQPDGQTQDFSDNLTSEIVEVPGVANTFTIFCLDESNGGSLFSTWNWILREIDGNGYPIYDVLEFPEPQFDGFTAVLSYNLALGRYEVDTFNNGNISADNVWIAETDSTIVPCSADAWIVTNQGCTLTFECNDNSSGGTFENFTLIRTFTADDGCGNTASCDVVYTWSIPLGCQLPIIGELSCNSIVTGDTSDAGAEDVVFGEFGGFGGGTPTTGNFYTLVGDGSDLTVLSTCNTADYDTRIVVLTDCGETFVAQNDDSSGCSGFSSELTFFAEDGVEYIVFMTGFTDTSLGFYELSVTCADVCLADAGTLTAVENPVTLNEGLAVLSATPDGNANQPAGFATVFVLTSGPGLAIVDAAATPDFVVDAAGLYTIHTLVYDPLTLDPLALPLDGSVSGFDVLDLINGQGLCASLDAAGAPIEVQEPTTATVVDCGGPGETVNVDQYPNNAFIEWSFVSSTGDALSVDFSGATENFFDDITIYDGADNTAPVLAVISGDLTGESYTSTGDSLYIVFDSDSSVAGFSFTVDVACTDAIIVDCDSAGETIDITNYPNNALFDWLFVSSTGDPLVVDFSGATENFFDDITIYDGEDATAPVLGVISGNLAGESFMSSGDSLYIVFDSDFSVAGFSFTVDVMCDTGATVVDCGGPGETVDVVQYPNNALLDWKYTSSTGDALVIDFSGSTEAGFDDITVYDGLDANAPVLGVFSGDLTGQSVTTTGQSVYIVFDSDGSVSGFSFTVNVACENTARLAGPDVDFTAYPVPFDHEVNIAYAFNFDTKVTIEVFDTKGLLVLTETNDRYVTGSDAVTTFDLSRYSNQLFYVKLTTSQGSVTKKIVSSGKK